MSNYSSNWKKGKRETMRKKKLDIGSIVEIFKVSNRSYCFGVVVSKEFSGNEYRVKDFTTCREAWYETKDLENVTETYPHLLTNCCLKYVDRGAECYYKITGVKVEEDNIYVWCEYDHFWHNIKNLTQERFELI